MPNLFTFNGRLGRLAYFGYSLLILLLGVLGSFVAMMLLQAGGGVAILAFLVVIALSIGLLWSGVSLGVRRLHDLDMSGFHYVWMMIVPGAITAWGQSRHADLIAIVGGLMSLAFALFLSFWPGTAGRNRYD